MKLNHDCVRSLLLELEEKLTLTDHVYLPSLQEYDSFKKYGEETCIYTAQKLIEANFLNGKINIVSNKVTGAGISSITWDGHIFLDSIRDNKIWSKTKDATKNLSSTSITILSTLASEFLKKQVGLIQ